jgi:hypothetical protein
MASEQSGLFQHREAIVAAHMDSEVRHDFEQTITTFSHPRYEVVPTGEVFEGEEALRQLLRGDRHCVSRLSL